MSEEDHFIKDQVESVKLEMRTAKPNPGCDVCKPLQRSNCLSLDIGLLTLDSQRDVKRSVAASVADMKEHLNRLGKKTQTEIPTPFGKIRLNNFEGRDVFRILALLGLIYVGWLMHQDARERRAERHKGDVSRIERTQ